MMRTRVTRRIRNNATPSNSARRLGVGGRARPSVTDDLLSYLGSGHSLTGAFMPVIGERASPSRSLMRISRNPTPNVTNLSTSQAP
jgi:hypothetical protein